MIPVCTRPLWGSYLGRQPTLSARNVDLLACTKHARSERNVRRTGGNYSLTGGFWALYAVQTPAAPTLSIQLTTTNTAMVYWPSPSTGFNLQVNTNLATTNWAPAASVTDNGSIKYIIVNPPAGKAFYRLKSP